MISRLANLLFKLHARREARRAGARQRTRDVSGVQWSFYEAGPPEGQPIIVFHGLATDKTMMLPVCHQLGSQRRLLLPDVPPFGSHRFDADICYDEDFYVRVLWDFIDDLVPKRQKPITLMGSSMGGCIAMLMAMARPQEVDRLVLFAPAGVMAPEPKPFIQKAIEDHTQLTIRDVKTFDDFMSVVFREPPQFPRLIRWLAAVKLSHEMERSLKVNSDFGAMLLDGLRHRLHSITMPTLLIWGTADEMLDVSTAQIFEEAIPNIQISRMSDEGHVMFQENPEETFQRVRDFLK